MDTIANYCSKSRSYEPLSMAQGPSRILTAMTNTKCGFLRLPLEIRQQIYAEILPDNAPGKPICFHGMKTQIKTPAMHYDLLLTCKKLSNESYHYYAKNNTFYVNSTVIMTRGCDEYLEKLLFPYWLNSVQIVEFRLDTACKCNDDCRAITDRDTAILKRFLECLRDAKRGRKGLLLKKLTLLHMLPDRSIHWRNGTALEWGSGKIREMGERAHMPTLEPLKQGIQKIEHGTWSRINRVIRAAGAAQINAWGAQMTPPQSEQRTFNIHEPVVMGAT